MPKRSRTDGPAQKRRVAKKTAPQRDENQLAFDSLQQIIEATEGTGKDPIAVLMGRRGGLKGGPARVANMTKDELRASALKAARARWDNRPGKPGGKAKKSA